MTGKIFLCGRQSSVGTFLRRGASNDSREGAPFLRAHALGETLHASSTHREENPARPVVLSFWRLADASSLWIMSGSCYLLLPLQEVTTSGKRMTARQRKSFLLVTAWRLSLLHLWILPGLTGNGSNRSFGFLPFPWPGRFPYLKRER